jgi:hypothetical protein
MDTHEFIQKAPEYYALGIAVTLAERLDIRTIQAVESRFAPGDQYFYFQKNPLIDEAFRVLARHGVVSLIPDDFGPTIFRPEGHLPDWLRSDTNPIPLFRKYSQIANKDWLKSAIRSVNAAYDNLQVEPLDFSQDNFEIQWEPIPLDRSNEALIQATEEVQKAIKSIEQDNGYAANAPGEREFVLSNLKAFQRALTEHSEIYWLQIRTFALEPLGRVIKRFGGAAVGIAATAARESILEWLKTAFSKALDWL